MVIYVTAYVQQHWRFTLTDQEQIYNRVALLLTPIVHIDGHTFHDGVRATLEVIGKNEPGRIKTSIGEDGKPTYFKFND